MQSESTAANDTVVNTGPQSSAAAQHPGRGASHLRDVSVDQGKDRLLRALDRLQRSVQTEAPDSVMHGELQVVTAALADFKQARSSSRNARVRSLAVG
ncbi:MAG: hypothetical protein ACLP01_19075 [Solirubrobacteraceae bacterium]